MTMMASTPRTAALLLLLGLTACFQLGSAEEPMVSTVNGNIVITPSEDRTIELESDFHFLNAGGDMVWSEDVLKEQQMCKDQIESLGKDLQAAETKCDKAVADAESKCTEAVEDLQDQIDFLKKLLKPCPNGQFSIKEPTPSTDRQCKNHRGPCTGATYEKAAPTPTSDRVCADLAVNQPCPSGTWLVFQATPFSPQRCEKFTTCTSKQYQTKAPTATSDRVCKTLTVCVLGKTYQTKAPTSTSDRICGNVRGPCASGEKETPPTLTSNRVCKAPVNLAQGCKSGIRFAKKVNDYIWLCSDGAVTNKGYDRMGQQCNTAGGFNLAGTKIHTVIGKPSSTAWNAAASFMRSQGHDYIMTGQPTRSCTWGHWTGGFNCNGLGYVNTGDSINAGNWNSLVDNNGNDRRSWPAANSPTRHRMPSMCVNAAHIPGAYLYGKYIWRLDPSKAQGCKAGIAFAKQVTPLMWLCSDGAVTNKGYDRVGQQCNNAGKFYLAGVKIHTKLGKPSQSAWSAAALYMRQNGHDYIITGQPTRSCSWSSWTGGFNCNGLGYVSTGDSVTSSNWNSLVDNNGNERRSWPSANSPKVHKLPSMCVKADQIPGAYLYGKYIWRLGAVSNGGPGCRSGIKFAKKVNDNMWLCSDGAVTNKGYDRVGQACNNAGKFYLGDVKVHTKLGKPDNTAWVAAATYMRQNGHDYIITGQATRSCSWNHWQSNFNCNGLGYVNSGENTSGSNWRSLLDNNNNERRSWPAANSPNVHKLASLCVKADQIGANLFGKYIWRL